MSRHPTEAALHRIGSPTCDLLDLFRRGIEVWHRNAWWSVIFWLIEAKNAYEIRGYSVACRKGRTKFKELAKSCNDRRVVKRIGRPLVREPILRGANDPSRCEIRRYDDRWHSNTISIKGKFLISRIRRNCQRWWNMIIATTVFIISND